MYITDSGYNLPKVTICTQLLQEYVYGEKNFSGESLKALPELARRFITDAYMCIYIDPDGVMYQWPSIPLCMIYDYCCTIYRL